MEERVRRTVTDIVEGVVGPGNARVQVTAEMDFNRVSETSERFDPEGRVVRSTSTSEEPAPPRWPQFAQGATAGGECAGWRGRRGRRRRHNPTTIPPARKP